MRFAPATIAPSHSLVFRAAQATCRQYKDEEQAVSITRLSTGVREVVVYYRGRSTYLGP